MKFSFDRRQEEGWLTHHKNYKRGGGGYDPFILAKAGAQAAKNVQLDILDSSESRRKRFDKICGCISSIINEINNQMKRPDHAQWLRGYLCFHTQNFQEGRAYYYGSATNSLYENPDFLADFGRIEYNAGRIIPAIKFFEKLFPLRENLTAEPLQAYRWLAKCYRHVRQFNKEVSTLEELKGIALNPEINKITIQGSSNHEDMDLSRKFVIERLGQALLDSQRSEEALSFVKEWIMTPEGRTVTLAGQGVASLLALGRENEAGEWAEEWAVKLHFPGLLSDFFQNSRRPFSAMKKKTDVLESLSSSEVSETHGLMFYSDNFDVHEKCSGDLMKLYKEAQRCFNNGFYQEGVEATFQFAEKLFTTEQAPTLLACCLAAINEFINVIPRTNKLEALFVESKEIFCDNAAVLSQYGRYLLLNGKYEDALAVFNDAFAKGAKKAPLFPVFFGKTYAGLGDEDKAKKNFEKSLKDCIGEDLVLAYLYAIEWASNSGRYFDVLRWYRSFLKDFLQLKGFPDADQGAQHYPRNQYVQRIFRLSGQAAFAINDHMKAVECYENLVANHGGLLIFATRNQESHFSYRLFAEASLLLSLAYCLAGNIEQSAEMFQQARELDPENPLLPAIEAMMLAAEGKVPEAFSYILTTPLEEWLFALVGGYILDKSKVCDVDQSELHALRARVGIAKGEIPSHGELFSRFESQSRKLAEVEEHTNDLQQTFNSFKHAINSLVECIPLPEDLLGLRQRAIEDGKDTEDFIEQCIKHLVKQDQKGKVTEKSRYSVYLPDVLWRRLDKRIQERVEAADRYVVSVLANTYDFGPAVLALASALEILLKDKLVRPLVVDIKRTYKTPELETSADLNSASLGTIPYLLANRGQYSPKYKSFLLQWVSTAFPTHVPYVLDVLPEQVTKIAAIRNSWAHGGAGVGYEQFQELEKIFFDEKDGVFLRLAGTD